MSDKILKDLRDAVRNFDDELARLTLHEVGLEGLLKFSKAIGTWICPQRSGCSFWTG